MRFELFLGFVSLISVVANDAVSLIQMSTTKALSLRTEKSKQVQAHREKEPLYTMTWHTNSMQDLQYNNLGGYGTDPTQPQEMRFRNVSWLHTESGDSELDLRITSIGTYAKHSKTSQQGLSGEFGVLYAKRKVAQRFLFELVYMGTTTVANVSEFDFTILDVDEAGEGQYCTTTVAMWGADGYYINPTAFHDMHVSADQHWHDHHTAIVACSNVTIKDGQVGNPTTVKTISQQQARAAIVYHFKNTGEFQLGLRFNKLRQVSFVGADNPLVWSGVLWHEVFEPGYPPQDFGEAEGQIYGWAWSNSSHSDWSVDQESVVVHNNLGGRGPVYTDPHEIRYSNVGQLKTYDNGTVTGEEWLDMVVILEEQYWGSEFINNNWNGANGQFGEIGLDRRSEGTFVFTFVYHGTNRSAVVPMHDFIIFDIDNMADPSLGEEYTVYGASQYWLVDDSYVLVDDSTPGEIALTSNVLVNSGAIDNPASWAEMTSDQIKVSCQFQFENTATWRVKFKTTATTQRAFLFAGTSQPPLPNITYPKKIATAAPTAFPTSMPTPPPTPVPTESPTESPTTAPTASPTVQPRGATTTLAPFITPTASPTEPPTASPTVQPRGATTTLAPFITPTASPTALPPTLFGDPHVRNLQGESFDINRASSHTLLLIPRGAHGHHVQLHLRGSVTPRGDSCTGQLYLTRFLISGQWLGSVGDLELSTAGEGFNVPAAIGLKVGESGNLSVQDFRSKLPRKMANVTSLHPTRPTELNKHVTTLLVRLYLGPTILRLSWEHQKEKDGYSNSIMLLTYGLGNVTGEVGGLLGKDDHEWAASTPEECAPIGGGGKSQDTLRKRQRPSCCVRAKVSSGDPLAEEV